jgi:cytochrome c
MGRARPLVMALLMLSGCDDHPAQVPTAVPGGDPERGALLSQGYGCGTCHTIPGIPKANATVGPPLRAMARQAYIAGVLPNTPDNLVRWIQEPQEVDPRTAMPDVGVTEADARDIAAYLYSLKE